MPQFSKSVISFFAIAVFATLAGCSKTAEEPAPAAAAPPAAAESPPAAKQDAGSFKIGELSALALRDGELELPNDNKVFGVGRTPADVAAVLSAAGQPTDKLHLDIHPLLVKTADRVLLFDTGAGNNFGPGAGKLSGSLAEAGVDPQSVTDIFISHSHGDHVGGLVNAEGNLAFPNASIHLSKAEWAYMSGLDHYKAIVPVLAAKVGAFAPGAELRARCRDGGGDQGPHAGSFGLPDHVGIRLAAVCRRRDAPLHRFRAEAGVDHCVRWRRRDRLGQPRRVDLATGDQWRARLRRALSVSGIGEDGEAR